MPEDVSLLKCLNCGNYTAGQKMIHRDDCWGAVVVEVITQQTGVFCMHCGTIYSSEPERCSTVIGFGESKTKCFHASFGKVFKQPTLAHMEAVIHLLIDALAKSQGHLPDPPDSGDSDDDKRI